MLDNIEIFTFVPAARAKLMESSSSFLLIQDKKFFRPSGTGRQRGRQPPPIPPPPLKFPVDVPFFADEPFKCAFFEKNN